MNNARLFCYFVGPVAGQLPLPTLGRDWNSSIPDYTNHEKITIVAGIREAGIREAKSDKHINSSTSQGEMCFVCMCVCMY